MSDRRLSGKAAELWHTFESIGIEELLEGDGMRYTQRLLFAEEIGAKEEEDATVRMEGLPTGALVEGLRQPTWTTTLPKIAVAADEAQEERDLVPIRVVGEGGTAQIVLATQRSLCREVVLKQLHPHQGGDATLLLQEGVVTGCLEHPNIVPVHAIGRDEAGQPLLVMKYVEGVPWSDLLKDQTHPHWRKLKLLSDEPLIRHIEILIEICNALEFAHSHGVLHRDIKPENVMLGAFGEVYLLDWGIACRTPDATTSHPVLAQVLARPRGLWGTPAYMAPEMLDPKQPLDVRTDVYLLGATLFEILMGKAPYDGMSMLEIVVSAFHEPPKVTNASCPPELARICEHAMRFAPDERIQDVEAFRAQLVEYLQHRTSRSWSDTAQKRLEELQYLRQLMPGQKQADADVKSADAHRQKFSQVFTECRFGCIQALHEWEGNPDAQAILDGALSLMFAVEIEQGHGDAAAVLLAEMRAPLASQREQLEALRGAQAEAEAHQQRLASLHRDLDASVSQKQRVQWMLSMGALATLFAIFRIWRGPAPTTEAGYQRAMLFAGLTLFAVLLGLFLGRRALLQNQLNRRFAGLIILCCLSILAHRGVRISLQAPLATIYIFDLLILFWIMATAAIALRLWLGWIAGVCLGSAVIGMFAPHVIFHVLTICIALCWLLTAFFWGRERTHTAPPDALEKA